MFLAVKMRAAAMLMVLPLAAALATAQEVVSENVPAKPAAGAAEPQFQSRDTRYKIAPGDSFDLNFELSPEFNQTAVAVQPDGFVTLRGIGDLNVQGQTVPELTQTLRGAYNKILNDPIISVILKDFEKPYFVADGQIGKPGKYDLRGDTTLTQAIAIAGGFKDSSRHSQVLLFRRVSDQWMEAKVINVKQMEKTGNLKEDPMLHPGDMLFVPKNTMSKVDKFFPSASMGTFFRPF
ncbi:MAG TPA: polysaccharide biosynthesis/export family protein [Candidatus Sulfotelmatobacter sp.]|jgi:polysaccharide biosynthesis/export protein